MSSLIRQQPCSLGGEALLVAGFLRLLLRSLSPSPESGLAHRPSGTNIAEKVEIYFWRWISKTWKSLLVDFASNIFFFLHISKAHSILFASLPFRTAGLEKTRFYLHDVTLLYQCSLPWLYCSKPSQCICMKRTDQALSRCVASLQAPPAAEAAEARPACPRRCVSRRLQPGSARCRQSFSPDVAGTPPWCSPG